MDVKRPGPPHDDWLLVSLGEAAQAPLRHAEDVRDLWLPRYTVCQLDADRVLHFYNWLFREAQTEHSHYCGEQAPASKPEQEKFAATNPPAQPIGEIPEPDPKTQPDVIPNRVLDFRETGGETEYLVQVWSRVPPGLSPLLTTPSAAAVDQLLRGIHAHVQDLCPGSHRHRGAVPLLVPQRAGAGEHGPAGVH